MLLDRGARAVYACASHAAFAPGTRDLLELSPSIAVPLADSLKAASPETRALVADVLGFSRDPNVIPALEAAAQDPDAETARAAQQAIDRIKLRASDNAPSRP